MTTTTAMCVRIYGAFGFRVATTVDVARMGYAGEIVEFDLGWYYLGERFYVLLLRRFISPDRASPFDEGGMNRFAYCAGDPINRIDPSGRGWLDWLWTGFAIVGAAIATVATGGALVGLLAGTITATVATTFALAASTVLGVASVGVEIASAVTMAKGDLETSSILGFVGLGLGVASAALSGLGTIGSRVGQFVGGGALAAKAATAGRAATSTTVAIAGARTTGIARGAGVVGNAAAATSGASRTVAVAIRVAGGGAKVSGIGARAASSPIRTAVRAVAERAPVAREALRTHLRPLSDVLRGPREANYLANNAFRRINGTVRAGMTTVGVMGMAGPMVTAMFSQQEMPDNASMSPVGPPAARGARKDDDMLTEEERLRRLQASQGYSDAYAPSGSPYAYGAADASLMSGLGLDGAAAGVRGDI